MFKIIEWVNLYLCNFERIKNVHRYGVSALISQMSTNPNSELFIRLPNVNRLAIIIIKNVNAAPYVRWFAPSVIELIEEYFKFPNNCSRLVRDLGITL
jgi:hypothetical protein